MASKRYVNAFIILNRSTKIIDKYDTLKRYLNNQFGKWYKTFEKWSLEW